jgi:2'-5' RNA ligase
MTRPRYVFVAKPPQAVREALREALARLGLDTQLGRSMFKPENWHQSLSDRFWEAPGLRETLLRAGELLSAQAVTLRLNRIAGSGEGSPHWAFRAYGKPAGFSDLLMAVRAALSMAGMVDTVGHTPHVTVSYTAPISLAPLKITPSVEWAIDEVLLVVGEGDGDNYHYDVVGRWQLIPLPASRQLSLF